MFFQKTSSDKFSYAGDTPVLIVFSSQSVLPSLQVLRGVHESVCISPQVETRRGLHVGPGGPLPDDALRKLGATP